jgi:hypothetical protein
MNQRTERHPTSGYSDDFNIELPDAWYPCRECGCSDASLRPCELCDECESKSPEAIARREQEARELAEAHERFTDREMAKHVSPEILETNTGHREFNDGAWQRVLGAWSPQSRDWLWLNSTTSGRCKSRIAYLALRMLYLEAIKDKVSKFGSYNLNTLPKVLWVDGDRLIEAFRVRHQYSLGNDAMGDAHELVEEARTCRFLVIDDLTKRRISGEAASDGLWEIIKHRHEWRLATIITDNYIPEALESMLHEKHAAYIIRRLAERCIQVDFDATPSESKGSDQWSESQQGES